MKKLLLLVVVTYKGKQNVKLVETNDGKSVKQSFLDRMAREIGCPEHGCYRIG